MRHVEGVRNPQRPWGRINSRLRGPSHPRQHRRLAVGLRNPSGSVPDPTEGARSPLGSVLAPLPPPPRSPARDLAARTLNRPPARGGVGPAPPGPAGPSSPARDRAWCSAATVMAGERPSVHVPAFTARLPSQVGASWPSSSLGRLATTLSSSAWPQEQLAAPAPYFWTSSTE